MMPANNWGAPQPQWGQPMGFGYQQPVNGFGQPVLQNAMNGFPPPVQQPMQQMNLFPQPAQGWQPPMNGFKDPSLWGAPPAGGFDQNLSNFLKLGNEEICKCIQVNMQRNPDIFIQRLYTYVQNGTAMTDSWFRNFTNALGIVLMIEMHEHGKTLTNDVVIPAVKVVYNAMVAELQTHNPEFMRQMNPQQLQMVQAHRQQFNVYATIAQKYLQHMRDPSKPWNNGGYTNAYQPQQTWQQQQPVTAWGTQQQPTQGWGQQPVAQPVQPWGQPANTWGMPLTQAQQNAMINNSETDFPRNNMFDDGSTIVRGVGNMNVGASIGVDGKIQSTWARINAAADQAGVKPQPVVQQPGFQQEPTSTNSIAPQEFGTTASSPLTRAYAQEPQAQQQVAQQTVQPIAQPVQPWGAQQQTQTHLPPPPPMGSPTVWTKEMRGKGDHFAPLQQQPQPTNNILTSEEVENARTPFQSHTAWAEHIAKMGFKKDTTEQQDEDAFEEPRVFQHEPDVQWDDFGMDLDEGKTTDYDESWGDIELSQEELDRIAKRREEQRAKDQVLRERLAAGLPPVIVPTGDTNMTVDTVNQTNAQQPTKRKTVCRFHPVYLARRQVLVEKEGRVKVVAKDEAEMNYKEHILPASTDDSAHLARLGNIFSESEPTNDYGVNLVDNLDYPQKTVEELLEQVERAIEADSGLDVNDLLQLTPALTEEQPVLSTNEVDYTTDIYAHLQSVIAEKYPEAEPGLEEVTIHYKRKLVANYSLDEEEVGLVTRILRAKTARTVIERVKEFNDQSHVNTRDLVKLHDQASELVNQQIKLVFDEDWNIDSFTQDYSDLLEAVEEDFPDLVNKLNDIYVAAVATVYGFEEISEASTISQTESVTLLPLFYGDYPISVVGDIGEFTEIGQSVLYQVVAERLAALDSKHIQRHVLVYKDNVKVTIVKSISDGKLYVFR